MGRAMIQLRPMRISLSTTIGMTLHMAALEEIISSVRELYMVALDLMVWWGLVQIVAYVATTATIGFAPLAGDNGSMVGLASIRWTLAIGYTPPAHLQSTWRVA